MKIFLQKVRKTKKKLLFVVNTVALSLISTTYAFASDLQSSKAVTGTKKLFQDGTKAVLIIIPVAAVLYIVWNLFKLQGADDEGDAKPIKKKIKAVAICAIAAELASTLVTIILSYYS